VTEAADGAGGAKQYRYFALIMAAFVTVMLCSNLIGPGKAGLLFGLSFSVSNLFFPIGYIFGDILTEVYGYAMNRKVIWAGFGALAFAAIMSRIIIGIPVDPAEPFNAQIQPALELVFGNSWRVILGSIIAFWAGDFTNAYVLAKMKILTRGRYLWTRTIGSTMVGQAVDSVIFYPLAFAGIWTSATIQQVILYNFVFKVGVEIVGTPFTYAIVGFLKRRENEDHYDVDTNFTPFSLENK
jgi:uncharacterized integral membrane protein (TIGR00697 family)